MQALLLVTLGCGRACNRLVIVQFWVLMVVIHRDFVIMVLLAKDEKDGRPGLTFRISVDQIIKILLK